MRVGFITQLLWERYGRFWVDLLRDTGAEIALPDAESTLATLQDARLAGVPGQAFRLAVAQGLALVDCDLIVAPSLNHGEESARGGGQDPWIADFPAALGTLGGLPPIMAVPVTPGPELEGMVVATVQQLTREPGLVKRLLDRHRPALRPPAYPAPRWGNPPPGRSGIAWLGQPWHMRTDLLHAATEEDAYPRYQGSIDPSLLREEGRRVDERLISTDLEVVGAARLFSRRGGISELRLVVDTDAGSDRWLITRVEAASGGKPVRAVELTEIIGGDPARLLVAPTDSGR